MVQVSPQKYFFDNNDFDEDALRRKREALRRPTFSQEEMEASRQTGFAQGREEGQRETMASLEARLAELMQQISHTAAVYMDNETQRLASFIDQSSLMTAQILVRAMPVLLKTLALPQIEDFIRATLRDHVKKGRLVVFVAPEYEDAIKTRMATMPPETPHMADWEIRADPTLSAYQSRVEWNGGGATWNPENVATVALQALFDNLPDDMKIHAMDGQQAKADINQPAATPDVDDQTQTEHTDDGEAP